MSKEPSQAAHPVRTKLIAAARILIAMIPWLGVMYFLHALEAKEIWSPRAFYRDIASIVFVATGMIASFFLYTVLGRWLR